MFKVSLKSDYALQVLALLACQKGKDPVPLKKIAQKTNLPFYYLSQIVTKLAHEGLLESKEGAWGGYVLARDPAEISLAEIYEIVEGPINQKVCKKKKCKDNDFCTCEEVWQPVIKTVKGKFLKKTLANLIKT